MKFTLFIDSPSYYRLRSLLQSRLLKKGTKDKIYTKLITSIVLYGSERWTLKNADEEKLKIFERRILRKIYGPTCENGVWRIKYNDELCSLYKDPDIVRVIKSSQDKMARTQSK
jgi:hypothetical protein